MRYPQLCTLYTHRHTIYYTTIHTRAHTHTTLHYTHKHEAKPTAAFTQLLPPSEPALGYLCTTQAIESRVVNPPGAGVVTHRRAVQVSRIEVTELKFHNNPNTTKQDRNSWAFASPGTHWCYSWVAQLSPGPHPPEIAIFCLNNKSPVMCRFYCERKIGTSLLPI